MSCTVRRVIGVAAWAAAALASSAPVLEPTLHAQSVVATGGFMDSATGVGLRPTLSAAEIQTFLPARGPFTFPSPYSTQGIRLTNGSDCGGADCVLPVGYSYWSNINNHTGSDVMLVFLGLDRRKGGGGPTLFSVDKRTGSTANLGPLFPADSPFSWSTGEGWYFSATRPTALYMNDGARILRYDVQSHAFETVFDASTQFGANIYVWQLHSSNDDRVHSATLRQTDTYEMLGCMVYDEGARRATFFPKKGDFDECQVDRSGRWIVIKENVDGLNGEDNRIIDLQTGTEQLLTDPNGASGHSDMGFGFLIAEDNFNPQPGAVRRWNLAMDMRGGEPALVRGQGELVYELSSWQSGVGHIAFGGARSGLPIEQQTACASNASRQALPRVNEIVCFPLDGSLDTLVVAPNLTDLDAAGGGADDYSKLPKGNLDVTGEYFVWTGNAGTSRLDAFIVRVPTRGASTAPAPGPAPQPSPAPAPTPTPPATVATGSAVQWTQIVNATVAGNELRKAGGCAGCPDAGAVSAQQIAGSGMMSFVAAETQALRVVGLGSGSAGLDPSAITCGLRIQEGRAEVREAGLYRTEVPVAAGDTLTIAVNGGTVAYAKNGAPFFTSQTAPAAPWRVVAALFDAGAAVSSVTVGGP